MGCDGGTIPKRDELVRTKKKPEQKDKTSELAFKWKHCAISQDALVKPIVACELGRLYNKEAVLEFLLDRSKFDIASQFDHLRGLKDIKELNFTDMPEKKGHEAEKGDSLRHAITPDFICPVVGIEMSGKHKFSFIWSCGCVVSERALKEVKSETCHKCGKPVKEEDIVPLNPPEEELSEVQQRMEQRRVLVKLAKKAQRAEKHKMKTGVDIDSASAPSPAKQSCTESSDQSTDAGAAKVSKKEVTFDSARKLITNGSSAEREKKIKSKKLCIQDDPKASKTFKSLFTTSDAAKNQQKAHWVTYNPMYY